MTSMLTGELGRLVQHQLSLGTYNSESDVLLEAVRLLAERDRRLAELRAELQPAIERLDRGEGLPLDIDHIKAEGRKVLAQRGAST